MRRGKQDSAKVIRRENVTPAGEAEGRRVQAGCRELGATPAPPWQPSCAPCGWGGGTLPRPTGPRPAPPGRGRAPLAARRDRRQIRPRGERVRRARARAAEAPEPSPV